MLDLDLHNYKVHYVWNARKSWGTTIFFLVRGFCTDFVEPSLMLLARILSQNRYIPPCLFALDLYGTPISQDNIGLDAILTRNCSLG